MNETLFPMPAILTTRFAFVDKMAAEFAAIRPPGGFNVALIDAPWEFQTFSDKGQGKGPGRHYNTMSVEEISAIPVDMLMADNSSALAWFTWPLAMRWREVIEAWGFDYAGLGWEWLKFNPKTGKYAFGGGYGTRKNVEPCLLLTRGDPQLRQPIESSMLGEAVIPEGVHSVRDFIEAMPLDAIRAPRRQHSRKPDEQYERIETLFDGPYVELFSRADRPGWTAWGDQVGLLNSAKSESIAA